MGHYLCEFIIHNASGVLWFWDVCSSVQNRNRLRVITRHLPSVCLLLGDNSVTDCCLIWSISSHFPSGSGNPLTQGGWEVTSYWAEMHSYDSEQSLEGVICSSRLKSFFCPVLREAFGHSCRGRRTRPLLLAVCPPKSEFIINSAKLSAFSRQANIHSVNISPHHFFPFVTSWRKETGKRKNAWTLTQLKMVHACHLVKRINWSNMCGLHAERYWRHHPWREEQDGVGGETGGYSSRERMREGWMVTGNEAVLRTSCASCAHLAFNR